jgi:NADPH-ferrihemoprotein reductase
LDIDITSSGIRYVTGDHVAIWPTNSETEVNRLVTAIGLTDKLDVAVKVEAIDPAAPKKYPFPVPTTYRSIFRHYIDIATPPTRPVLASIARYAPSDTAKARLETLSSDKDAYRNEVVEGCQNLGQLLESIDNTPGAFAGIPFDLIVESLTRLQPRYYSISSSSLESPNVISVTAVTLKYSPDSAPEHTVYGVATNYLWAMHQATHPESQDGQVYPEYNVNGPRDAYLTENGARIPVHVRKSNFKLPRNPSVPVILVGPG